MVVYNFEDYYNSDKYRELLDELLEFLGDTQVRIMEYALNLNSNRAWRNWKGEQDEGDEIQVDPDDLADVNDPKVRRLMELYFEMETTLEDLRD